MMSCEHCAQPMLLELDRCPHCWRPSLYPNVRDATRSSEVDALRARYDAAFAKASESGCREALKRFEQLVAKSQACKAIPRWELDRLVSSDGAVAATYYQQIRGACRLPDDNRWDRLRRIADVAFFRSYSEKVHFGALSTKQRWLEHYGDGAVFFREDMIAHRATVFEKNTACWADECAGDLSVPVGFRAPWEDRAQLAVAKFAPAAATSCETLEAHLINCGKTSADDEFIEVHIYGGFTIRSVQGIVVNDAALSELGRASLRERAGTVPLDINILGET